MIKRIILLALLGTMTLQMNAQDGLSINQLFGSRYRNNSNAVEVLVKGNKLEKYNLSLFRSLSLKNNPKESQMIEELVAGDIRNAVDKETGRIGGKLYFGFYQLQPKKGKYRYIFYRNSYLRKGEEPEVTIVYMEGNTTLKELKNLFK